MTDRYEFRIQGRFDLKWGDCFDNLEVSNEGAETILRGPVEDQSALYGVLLRMRDLGLSLISVKREKVI